MNNSTETTSTRLTEILDAGRRLQELEDQGIFSLSGMADFVQNENVLVEYLFYHKVCRSFFKVQPKKKRKRLVNLSENLVTGMLLEYEETGDLTNITNMRNQMKEVWFRHLKIM